MSDAKIILTTIAESKDIKELNAAMVESTKTVSDAKKELKKLNEETKDGAQATAAQKAEIDKLNEKIGVHSAAIRKFRKEINRTSDETIRNAKKTAEADKATGLLAKAFNLAKDYAVSYKFALGGLVSNIATGVISAITELTSQIINLGAEMQQTVSQLSAMKNVTGDATEACRLLNDVYRNTNFQESAVQQMGIQLMNMGYSAQNAAGLIQLCADAAAGLGTGQQGAQQLVDAISRMQAVGELTSKQMTQLKMSGVDMDAAFKSLGMTGEQAMKAVEEGTLDTQQAIGALTSYLHEFDGSMAVSKNNTIDAWGDVTGNLQTFCAEIGKDIFDAFNQSEIVQELIDFTQFLVDMVRSDAPGAFTDLKAIAGEALDFIGGLLGFVLDTIKLIIVSLHNAYEAFKNFGAEVIDAVRPAVDVVLTLYDAVKSVLSIVGKSFKEYARSSGKNTFGPDPDDADSYAILQPNKFKPRSTAPRGGRSGGGGGGGSAKAQLTEEEKAVDALIKKYADAEKQQWALLKSSLELAKVNTGMMVGDAKAVQQKQDKINDLQLAHDQLMDSYKKELMLAGQIKDADQREKTIDRIMAQIKAEKELFDAKVDAAEWEKNYADLQKENKSLMDRYFGDPEDIQPKIDKIKEELTKALEQVNAAMAAPDEEEQLSGMAKILKMTPEALEEELAKKGESLSVFAEKYKENLTAVKAAQAENLTATKQWHDYLKNYATDIGKSMGNALTDWITGAKTASQALKDFVQGLIKNALQLLAQWLSIYAIFLLTGDPHLAAQAATKAVFGVDIGKGAKGSTSMIGGGSVTSAWNSGAKGKVLYSGHASGGLIVGSGTGTSDSIPAMLSNGEYVIRSAAVDRIGVGTLDAINSGRASHFAEGGSVDGAEVAVGSSVTLNISAMDAASFSGFLERGGLDSIKQALFSNNREFGSEVGVW